MFSWSAFLTYAVLMTATPGPNNIASMSNGLRVGFWRAIRFNQGIFLGFLVVMQACTFLCSTATAVLPVLKTPLLVAGTLYMLWLCRSVWCAAPVTDEKFEKKAGDEGHEDGEETSAPKGFTLIDGAMLQFVNVKIYFACIVSMQSFVLPHFDEAWILSGFAVLLAVIGSGFTVLWTAFGAAFRRFFIKYDKATRIVIVAALFYCIASMWM